MKKEDIYVVIDSEEQKQRAVQILTDAGETIWDYENSMGDDNYLICDKDDQEWFTTSKSLLRNRKKITLDELEALLKPDDEYYTWNDLKKILYDCTGLLSENHPSTVEAMEKYADFMLKKTDSELTFPREMMVFNDDGTKEKHLVVGIFQEMYMVKYSEGFLSYKNASEIEPPKPTFIQEVEEMAKERGLRVVFMEVVEDEPKFVLPEKWAVKKTPENFRIINEWANKMCDEEYMDQSSYIHSGNIGLLGLVTLNGTKEDGFTEITFEQFKKYVLKEN